MYTIIQYYYKIIMLLFSGETDQKPKHDCSLSDDMSALVIGPRLGQILDLDRMR